MAEGRLPGRSRRPVIRLALGLAVVALAAGLGVLAISARSDLTTVSAEGAAARDEVLAGAAIVEAGGTADTTSQIQLARADFRHAEAHFSRIKALLAASVPLRFVRLVPILSTQVRAADALADLGIHLSRVGDLGAQALERVTANKTASTGGPGQQIIKTLELVDPLLARAQAEVAIALADRKSIPETGLLPQLHNAVIELDHHLNIAKVQADLARVRATEPAIRQLLGVSGPRTFLVLEQDSAELRPTGGFIGSLGFLGFNQGQMAPFEPVDVVALEHNRQGQVYGFGSVSTGVPAPAPLAKAFPLNSLTLRDSNWSPDFPTSAREAEALLQIEAGKKVDGVIAIDPYFIEDVLKVVGPVKVPETGDVVDSSNFFATTLNRVELNQAVTHKSFLAQAARAVFAKFLSASSKNALALAQLLASACQSRSLQAYFHDKAIEDFADSYDCGGQTMPLHGDGLMIIDANLGGNKDDFWLQRKFTLGIKLEADGNALHTLQIHYSGLTPHDIHLTQYRGYIGWLRVYVPPGATLVNVSGAQMTEATELGRRVFQGWVFVPFYKDLDVTIAYSVEANELHASRTSFQFFWQKQAGRPADPIVVSFTAPPGSKLKPILIANDPVHGTIVTSDLSVDRQITFKYTVS